jgi:hypothetical protein
LIVMALRISRFTSMPDAAGSTAAAHAQDPNEFWGDRKPG